MSFLVELFCCCLNDNQSTTTRFTNTLTNVNNTVPVGLIPSDNRQDLELTSLRDDDNNNNNNNNIVSQSNDIVQHVSVISMLS